MDEVNRLENEMALFFKNTNKDFVMTEEDDEIYRNNNTCRLCWKNIESYKCRDHCQLTSIYRGAAHGKSKLNATQKQSNYIPLKFQKFSNYDCHLSFKSWLIKRIMK